MSVTHVEYDPETGHIFCENVSPSRNMQPAEGPHPNDPSRYVLHGSTHGNACKVERGKIVPIGTMERVSREKRDQWFKFRQKRQMYFETIRHKEGRFYPLTAVEEATINAQMSESRDLPQMYQDPIAAMARLDEIWAED